MQEERCQIRGDQATGKQIDSNSTGWSGNDMDEMREIGLLKEKDEIIHRLRLALEGSYRCEANLIEVFGREAIQKNIEVMREADHLTSAMMVFYSAYFKIINCLDRGNVDKARQVMNELPIVSRWLIDAGGVDVTKLPEYRELQEKVGAA